MGIQPSEIGASADLLNSNDMPSTLLMDQQQCLLTGPSCTQHATQQTAAELNAWHKPMCHRANCNKDAFVGATTTLPT
jgi:hypothetical protein